MVRVPYAVALALLVALLDLVPLVGATIAAVIVSAVALFHSLPVGIATIAFFIVYQQFENYILVPRVMQRTAEVSPLATVVAALLGGALLGVVGALIAIPVAATVQIVVDEVVVPRQRDASLRVPVGLSAGRSRPGSGAARRSDLPAPRARAGVPSTPAAATGRRRAALPSPGRPRVA